MEILEHFLGICHNDHFHLNIWHIIITGIIIKLIYENIHIVARSFSKSRFTKK